MAKRMPEIPRRFVPHVTESISDIGRRAFPKVDDAWLARKQTGIDFTLIIDNDHG